MGLFPSVKNRRRFSRSLHGRIYGGPEKATRSDLRARNNVSFVYARYATLEARSWLECNQSVCQLSKSAIANGRQNKNP